MKNSLSKKIAALKAVLFLFDEAAIIKKEQLLTEILEFKFSNTKDLLLLHDYALFVIAYPANKKTLLLAEKILTKISVFLKQRNTDKANLENSGLPYTSIFIRFSHDMLHWLNQQKQSKTTFYSFGEDGKTLNEILKLTLNKVEKEITTVGLSNEELLLTLGIDKKNYIDFLLAEFDKLNDTPFIKDFLWEEMKPYFQLSLTDKKFSRAYNRIDESVYYHPEILKKFPHQALIETELPTPAALNKQQLEYTVEVIKKTMVLTCRETDTSTFMDEQTLRLYKLERGISIAIYGMKANRQMALQSYIGYTLFKNGLPAAYGGSWIFGKYAMFGLNIFEQFRGGESGYIMCQLLRVYKQVFNLNTIEIEAYQFGKDNEDGIKSGAFWFYYRYGFKPIDKNLLQLANKEYEKIKSTNGYRSSEKILLQLAESNMQINFANKASHSVVYYSEKITNYINRHFNTNRSLAQTYIIKQFQQENNFEKELNQDELQALQEICLLAAELKIKNNNKLSLLKNIVISKPVCPYKYNKLLTGFLQ